MAEIHAVKIGGMAGQAYPWSWRCTCGAGDVHMSLESAARAAVSVAGHPESKRIRDKMDKEHTDG